VHDYYSGEEEISVEDLIEEQRSLARSPNLIERVVGSLCIGAILKKQLMGLPSSAISQLMTDHISCRLNLLAPESVIAEIASKRLDEKYETSLVCPECRAQL
jgi:broad specificity polyphosphatase/5'/3'-nucleotidase SurE